MHETLIAETETESFYLETEILAKLFETEKRPNVRLEIETLRSRLTRLNAMLANWAR